MLQAHPMLSYLKKDDKEDVQGAQSEDMGGKGPVLEAEEAAEIPAEAAAAA